MRNSNSLEIKYTDFKPGLLPTTYIQKITVAAGGAQMFEFNFIYPVNNAGMNQRYL